MAKYVNSDGLQYAISKIKTLLNGKANTSHNHDITGLTNFNTAVYNATLSRTANTFLAAPNGSNGAGSFRKIVENDLPAELPNHIIPYYKAFSASGGTSGYLKIINIDMSGGTYMNQPIIFFLGQRSSGLCWLTVIFSQSNTAGSSAVSKFMKFGSDIGLYIVKTASDKFSIYAKKSESYDNISLYGYYKGSYMNNCKLTFTDELVSAVPSGYTEAGWGGRASYANSAGSTDNSLTIQTNGTTAATFNGSAAKTVNITPSNIGAATATHTHNIYLPLAGGTMAGTIKKTSDDGSFISARDRTTIMNTGTISKDAFYPIITSRAMSGTWSIGTLESSLFFVYGSDTNYSAGTNKCTTINLSPEGNMNINATSANCIQNYLGRPTSIEGYSSTNASYRNKIIYTLATSAITSNKPPRDGCLVYFGWDTANGFGSQFLMPNNSGQNILFRTGKDGGGFSSWKRVYDETMITYGTAAPSGTANTGDIYIQYS